MQISLLCSDAGAVVPTTISSHCCAIPFTLNGNIHYSCTDNGAGVGCYYGDRQWKQCRQPAGRFSKKKRAVNFVSKRLQRPHRIRFISMKNYRHY